MDYVATVSLKYERARDSHRGVKKGWRWLRLLVVHDSPSDVRYFPFVSLDRHVQSKELPATTEGEWRRRHSSQGHKGGPETVPLNVQGVV